jgi:hypothetical protein
MNTYRVVLTGPNEWAIEWCVDGVVQGFLQNRYDTEIEAVFDAFSQAQRAIARERPANDNYPEN